MVLSDFMPNFANRKYRSIMYIRYFSETTLCHLKPQQGLSVRYQRRALDVTLGCKLTVAYGKYHLAMLHRELFMSEDRTTYQQAERMAGMMNQMTIIHSSPSDFLQTKEESVNECIDTYKEFKQLVDEYADEYFVPSVVEDFCKKVYADDEHFIFFKRSATCITPFMPMRCYGISRGRLTTRRSAGNSKNSVG